MNELFEKITDFAVTYGVASIHASMYKTVAAENNSDSESDSDVSQFSNDSRVPNFITNKVGCIISLKNPSIFPTE